MTDFPEATHSSRSWVVYDEDGKPVREFFSRANAMAAFGLGYRVVLIGDHLASLNYTVDNPTETMR